MTRTGKLRLSIFSALVCVAFGERMMYGQAAQIRVGPNIHVSQSHDKYMMGEVLLSADPTDPDRLLGCAIVWAESENRQWTVVYLSTDDGKSWQPTLETNRIQDAGDPTCVLGRGGLAAHIAIGWDKNERLMLCIYRSGDGGKTWTEQANMPMSFEGVDRDSLTVDTTDGKFGNRLYLSGESDVRDLGGAVKDGFAVWRSSDGGVSYEGPVKRAPTADHHLLDIGNSVILSDGTMVSLFGDLKHHDTNRGVRSTPEESNAVLEAVTITDGGNSISEAVKVDDFFMPQPSLTIGTPTIAADSGDGPFRDRLYATWTDERAGRSGIRFSYSIDKGKTWSNSTGIDDVPGPIDAQKGPDNFLPTVAVNKAGIVLVTWYDRRKNSDCLGWYVRARASLDGGETWLPSVQVSEQPNTFSARQKLFTFGSATQPEDTAFPSNKGHAMQRPTHVDIFFEPRVFFAGDYAGLAADLHGIFHAFWIDDRTGLPQIWTAPIVVSGKAVRNGSADLAELEDVSSYTEIQIASSHYDRASNEVKIGVRLKNSSTKVVRGPVKLRLVNITSRIGSPTVANADNQITGPGAVWDLSFSLRDNALNPGETSPVRQLVFRVDKPRELVDGKNVRLDLLDFDVRIFARKMNP